MPRAAWLRGTKPWQLKCRFRPDVLSRVEHDFLSDPVRNKYLTSLKKSMEEDSSSSSTSSSSQIVGALQEPPWLAAARLTPPSDRSLEHKGAPRVIAFPEDGLIKEYLDKFPDARVLLPVDAHDKALHPVKLFALRQLQHMQAGVPKRDAFRITNRELRSIDMTNVDMPAAAQVADGRRLSAISRIQAKEERVLLAAHAKVKAAKLQRDQKSL
ncbi:hypothetical protein PPROV_000810700 [Pycnococcus provasolii]|uniref:Uncharacterized protein n=1 Tax=Pycnococcus provasolii TaxID=41880 RepID=A0A830HQT2_9CHLO|nr:hypothetical protein PPROV_000810700 [Pycnococcus provasolii]